MSKIQKLITRFVDLPSDFHYDELVRILAHFRYYEVRTGKTSGSRVRFLNSDTGTLISIHKPHPTGIMKRYQLKQIKETLGL